MKVLVIALIFSALATSIILTQLHRFIPNDIYFMHKGLIKMISYMASFVLWIGIIMYVSLL